MKTTRKSMVIALFAASMLTSLAGCTTTSCQTAHPFSTLFIDHEVMASDDRDLSPRVTAKEVQTASEQTNVNQSLL